MRSLMLSAALSVAATAALADTYDFTGFSSVSAANGVSVKITEGREFSVMAEAERGSLRRLILEQDGATLRVNRRTWPDRLGLGQWDKLHVTITLPELAGAMAQSGAVLTVGANDREDMSLSAEAGAHLAVFGFAGGHLTLSAQSGASVQGGNISPSVATAAAQSGASITLDGSCEEITATAASGASVVAKDLLCGVGTLVADGGASLSAHTTTSVDASAQGAATVTVLGNPSEVVTFSTDSASITVQ